MGVSAISDMMLRLNDFLKTLEGVAPARWAEPWDNPGLQVGSPDQRVGKVFSSLDPTLDALEAACKAHAQLLFTHHPLIFKPLSQIRTDAFPGTVVAEAIKRGIAIVAAHTNLDAAPGGINDILADLLGLTDIEILKPVEAAAGAGLGRIGNLPAPVDLSTFSKTVKGILGAPEIRMVGRRDAHIQRLAVVGGSGGSLLSLACEKGADLLLTGDVGHHAALEAEALGISLMDGGHFYSERTAFRAFAKTMETLLRSEGWDIEIEADEEANPLRTCTG